MILTISEPERPPLETRMESLFHDLVTFSWWHPTSRDILDAKVLVSAQIANERISWDLMHLVVNHLDAAQVLYPEVKRLYDAAWDIFADIRIPFVAVDPPPLTEDDLRDIAETSHANAQDDNLSHEEQLQAALDYLVANSLLAERTENDD